jgi:hypothetical protein
VGVDQGRSKILYLLLAGTSALTAICAWFVIGVTHPLVATPVELMSLTQPTEAQLSQMRSLYRTNDTLSLVIFATFVAAAGMPLYASSMRWSHKLLALGVAITLGIASGFAMGRTGYYLHDWLPVTWDPLVSVAVRWTLMLLPLAILAALLVAMQFRQTRALGNLLTGSVVGSLFAAGLYAFGSAFFFPNENADAVLPIGSGSRLLLFFLVPLLIWSITAKQADASRVQSDVKQPAVQDLETAQ